MSLVPPSSPSPRSLRGSATTIERRLPNFEPQARRGLVRLVRAAVLASRLSHLRHRSDPQPFRRVPESRSMEGLCGVWCRTPVFDVELAYPTQEGVSCGDVVKVHHNRAAKHSKRAGGSHPGRGSEFMDRHSSRRQALTYFDGIFVLQLCRSQSDRPQLACQLAIAGCFVDPLNICAHSSETARDPREPTRQIFRVGHEDSIPHCLGASLKRQIGAKSASTKSTPVFVA
jgi:hypothetical protein